MLLISRFFWTAWHLSLFSLSVCIRKLQWRHCQYMDSYRWWLHWNNFEDMSFSSAPFLSEQLGAAGKVVVSSCVVPLMERAPGLGRLSCCKMHSLRGKLSCGYHCWTWLWHLPGILQLLRSGGGGGAASSTAPTAATVPPFPFKFLDRALRIRALTLSKFRRSLQGLWLSRAAPVKWLSIYGNCIYGQFSLELSLGSD